MGAARGSHQGLSGVISGVDSRRPLSVAFFSRPPDVVARALLGAILECDGPDGRASGRIVETEAYFGPTDPASHAAAGLTPRTKHLFGEPGTSYVYRSYGIHWCFNTVSGPLGSGRAVLVRAVEPLEGMALMLERRFAGEGGSGGAGRSNPGRRTWELTNGPGKLCEALGITGDMSGLRLQRPPLIVRRGSELPDLLVSVSPRIGITKAVAARHRYFVRDSRFVSRTPTHFKTTPYKLVGASR
jgi:DNA-3-methyladenine glycosylase